MSFSTHGLLLGVVGIHGLRTVQDLLSDRKELGERSVKCVTICALCCFDGRFELADGIVMGRAHAYIGLYVCICTFTFL